jgi:hypothetical protein
MHYTSADNGAIRYTEGARTFTFKTDGTPVPGAVYNRTRFELRYSKESETHYTEVSFLKGKPFSTKTLEISPDNRRLTMVETQPDGSTTHTRTSSYERVGTGQGLLGDWRNTAVDGYRIKDNGDGSITFETLLWIPPANAEFEVRSQMLLRADGTFVQPTGPHAMPHLTMALVRTKDGSYQMLKQFPGEPTGQSLFTLSFDGKSLTESFGTGNSANQPMRADDPTAEFAVYDKQ